MSVSSQEQLETGNKTVAITKKYTQKETRELIQKIARTDCDPELILKELGGDILPKFIDGNQKEQKEARNLLEEKSLKAMMALGVETHFPLIETVGEGYRPLVMEFSRYLISELDCKTTHEKALAQLVVNAYIRVIDNSRRLNNELGGPGQEINENRTKYISMLSIQIDRANRQFLNALVTLKQLKAPAIEMNIKAKTAFIAQNQQINAEGTVKTSNE